MTYICTVAAGQTFTEIDVCKTQVGPSVVPIPYPNVGLLQNAISTTTKVLISNCPTITSMSKIPITEGDESGTLGGIVSESFKSEVAFVGFSKKVFFENKPVVRYFDQVKSNNGNSLGDIVEPSQLVVEALE